MNLLDNLKRIRRIFSQSANDFTIIEEICEELVSCLQSNVQLIDNQGYTFKYTYKKKQQLESLMERSISFPIEYGNEKLGSLLLLDCPPNLSYDQRVLIEYSIAFLSLILKKNIEDKKQPHNVFSSLKVALKNLSHSEKIALKYIVEEMKDKEDHIVMRKLALKAGIGQSSLVNVLRKLASARVLEAKSMGMKGTYLRICDDQVWHVMKKQEAIEL